MSDKKFSQLVKEANKRDVIIWDERANICFNYTKAIDKAKLDRTRDIIETLFNHPKCAEAYVLIMNEYEEELKGE